jgi:hypothetical protein
MAWKVSAPIILIDGSGVAPVCGRVPPMRLSSDDGAHTERRTEASQGLRPAWRPGESGNPRGGASPLLTMAADDGGDEPRRRGRVLSVTEKAAV